MRKTFGMTLILIALVSTGWTQSKSTAPQTKAPTTQAKPTTKCAAVTPKNAQEALTMEQSSNKNGCWVRNLQTGKLEFIGDSPQDYKPLLHDNAAVAPIGAPASPGPLAGDAIGQWKVTITNSLQDQWMKGTLEVDSTLQVEFRCETEPTFSMDTLRWSGPPKSCVGSTGNRGACDWAFSKVTPGVYQVRCGSGKNKVSGFFVIEKTDLKGKVLNNDDYWIFVSGSKVQSILPLKR